MCEHHQHDTATATATDTATEEAPAPVAPEAPTSSCCGGHVVAAPATTTRDAQDAQDDVAECPVMPGSVVNKADAEAAGLYRDHNGQRYWFCCAACGPMWDADPDKYAAA